MKIIKTIANFRTPIAPIIRNVKRISLIALGFLVFIAMQMVLANSINDITRNWYFITGVFVGIVAIIISIWKPQIMAIVWVVLAPIATTFMRIDPGQDIPSLTFDRMVLYPLVLVLLFRSLKDREFKLQLRSSEIFFILFPVYIFISNLYIPGKDILNDLVKTMGRAGDIVIIYFVIKNCITSKKHVDWIITSLVILGVYSAIMGIADQYLGSQVLFKLIGISRSLTWAGGSESGRSMGPFNTPTSYAFATGIAAILALYCIKRAEKVSKRVIYFLCFCITTYGWFLSYTRAAYAPLALALIVMAFISAKKTRRLYASIFAIVVIVSILGLPIVLSDNALRERLTTSETLIPRIATNKAMINMFKENMAFGMGIGNAKGQMGNYAGYFAGVAGYNVWRAVGSFPHRTNLSIQFGPHNTHLLYLAEHGIVGVSFFYLSFILFLVLLIKMRNKYKDKDYMSKDFTTIVICFFIATYTISANTGVFDNATFMINYMWLLIACAVRLYEISKDESIVNPQTI